MANVSLRNIDIAYGSATIVKSLQMEIADGEFTVLVGPSGCGKSTILRLIAGLEPHSGGDIFIDEDNVSAANPADRNVAMVFQNYALYPNMSVFENIAFGMKIRKIDATEIDRAVREVAKMVGLTDHLHKRPGRLSGGQRQRVALARAIVRHPKVFLFDEPLSNLDAEFRASIRLELRQLHKRLGATMIYVTHDQVEAMTMGDKIAVLAPIAVKGTHNLMQYDTPDMVYSKPTNLFVARFIGSPKMNTFEAESSGQTTIRIGDQDIAVKAKRALPSKVIVGIRPEHVVVGAHGGGPTITGRVAVTENLGHERLVFTETKIGPITQRASDQTVCPTAGDNLELTLLHHRLHFFDAVTEERIEMVSDAL
ncbi:sugar ABC transporter ATP-binding protein [Mesorhizobium sp. 131-3-5]|nr:sugar ABC transporter ATP-binding protein [Mesorhizobium sp. 131-3-5]